MSRIYISGAITGTDDYMERFKAVEDMLKADGHMVYNPAHANSFMPEGTTYEEYMKVSFLLLDMADTIYMLKGWENSPGACREHAIASFRKKKIIYEDEIQPLDYKDMGQPDKCRFYHNSVCCYPIEDEPNCPNYPGNEGLGNTICSIE